MEEIMSQTDTHTHTQTHTHTGRQEEDERAGRAGGYVHLQETEREIMKRK